MEHNPSNPNIASQDVQEAEASSTSTSMHSSQLLKLFEDELKGMYWTEKALTRTIRRMINNATTPELIDELTSHLAETERQVKRVEQIFVSIDKKPMAKRCIAMEGLIDNAGVRMESCEAGAMCDAGIISSIQKIEHYQIASYGTLLQFAATLWLDPAIELLDAMLEEIICADERMTVMAASAIHIQITPEEEDEEYDYEPHQEYNFLFV